MIQCPTKRVVPRRVCRTRVFTRAVIFPLRPSMVWLRRGGRTQLAGQATAADVRPCRRTIRVRGNCGNAPSPKRGRGHVFVCVEGVEVINGNRPAAAAAARDRRDFDHCRTLYTTSSLSLGLTSLQGFLISFSHRQQFSMKVETFALLLLLAGTRCPSYVYFEKI